VACPHRRSGCRGALLAELQVPSADAWDRQGADRSCRDPLARSGTRGRRASPVFSTGVIAQEIECYRSARKARVLRGARPRSLARIGTDRAQALAGRHAGRDACRAPSGRLVMFDAFPGTGRRPGQNPPRYEGCSAMAGSFDFPRALIAAEGGEHRWDVGSDAAISGHASRGAQR